MSLKKINNLMNQNKNSRNKFFKLNKYAKNISSQYGEDGIIEYLTKTSSLRINKSCVEFGAHDGIANSNTYNLWKNKNYSALLIEADKNRFNNLVKNVEKNANVVAVNKFVGFKGDYTLENIIESTNIFEKNNIGVLSIDIDSCDYFIFKYLKIKPQIIVIEFNNSIPGYIDYNDPEDQVFLRCSAKSIQNLGFEKGYITVACTITNVILIRNDCYNSEKHPYLPVEYLMDYENMSKNNDRLYSIIHSQLITTYPISTKPLNFLDKFYLHLTRRLYSIFGIRIEKFIKPNASTKSNLDKSGLFY